MAFYNNKVAIAYINRNKLYLFRTANNEIIMDYYNENEKNIQDIIAKDAIDEFDILVDEEEVYLIYQDKKYNLNIITINDGKTSKISLTNEPMPRLYELNMFKSGDDISIIYLTLQSENERIFRIHHHLLQSDQWVNYDVDSTRIGKILNPLKLIIDEDRVLLGYYYLNQICIKEFNFQTKEWSETHILTDNNEKLYIDMIKKDNYIHLVYSEFLNGNLVIKYSRYAYDSYSLVKDKEELLSNESNPGNPTLIIHNNVLWVVWNESLGLYSRYSKDDGLSWSPIYFWKESKVIDFVRYKYEDNESSENIKFDYSFGTLYPDIKFLGFGALENVQEIEVKKKNTLKFPRF